MSFEQIENSVIAKAEQLIREGKTYKEIKETCSISDGTIAKIKQGKITSARVYQPQCSNREEELTFLYTSTKKELIKCENDYNILLNDFNNKVYKIQQLEERIELLLQTLEKRENSLKLKDYTINDLKRRLKDLEETKHNNPYEDDKKPLEEPPKANKDINKSKLGMLDIF